MTILVRMISNFPDRGGPESLRAVGRALIPKSAPFFEEAAQACVRSFAHAIDRFIDGERIHPTTRKKLAQMVEELERRRQ